MIEFFENLKQKRLEKKLSLREIAEKTLLNLSILNDIENGNIDKLPKGYRRIYLRRYVKEIGLNPDDVMKDYNLLVGDVDVELIQDNSEDNISLKKSNITERFSREKMIHILSVSGIIIVFFFLVWGIFYVVRNVHLSKNYKVSDISMDEVAAAIDTMELQDSVENAILPVKKDCTKTVQPDYFSVDVFVSQNCWIKQIVDFRDTTEYILNPGNVKHIQALSRIKLIAGNGSAVSIKQNGKISSNLAPKGTVLRRLIIGRQGIIENIHVFPRSKNKETNNEAATDSTQTDSTNTEQDKPNVD